MDCLRLGNVLSRALNTRVSVVSLWRGGLELHSKDWMRTRKTHKHARSHTQCLALTCVLSNPVNSSMYSMSVQ